MAVVMYPSGTEDVAKLPGVRDAVREVGGEIYFKAEANLAGHRQSGNARIEISDTDYYPNWGVTVSMIDERAANAGGPGALAIEFGHFVRTGNGFPRYVEGLHILGRAAGLRA
jgi:hypothetical protein